MESFKKQPLIKEALVMLVVVYLLNKMGVATGLYLNSSPLKEYDSIVHFLAGFTCSLGLLWFYFYSGLFAPLKRSYKDFFLIALLGIIFVAFTWEIYELFAGVMDYNATGYGYDTSLDILFGTLGTVVGCIYAYNQELKWKLFFTVESAQLQEQI